MLGLNNKRKFLVACSKADSRSELSNAIQKHIAMSLVVTSPDGIDATNKLNNDLPHVVILEENLAITGAKSVFESGLKLSNSQKTRTAFIILGPLPDDVKFIDEVLSGQLQYVSNSSDETKLVEAITRSLNFITHEPSSEFFLKFLAPNEVLIEEGADAESVYILRRGELKAYLLREEGEIHLGNVQVGEFVGEMAYVNGEARSAHVCAISDCELIEIPIGNMDKLLFKNNTWARALMKTLSSRVKNANVRLQKKD